LFFFRSHSLSENEPQWQLTNKLSEVSSLWLVQDLSFSHGGVALSWNGVVCM
jgi:hypothetical protein